MHLADRFYLLGLLLIPLAHHWWMSRNRPARVSFSLPIPSKVAARAPQKVFLILRYAAFALFLLALARPQSSFRQTERSVSGVDIMLVLDLSASMEIEDLGEASRLTIAKQTMEKFVKGRQNDRIGFVAFSGEPVTLVPPTLDYGLVLKELNGVDTGLLKDGTAIGDGLALAVSHLRNSTAKSKVIILMTDGDNNLGQIDPATAGELAAGYGIRAYTIAIGREGRVKLPIKQKTIFGNTVTTYQWFDNALNPELLQQIAKTTRGKFFRVTEGNALDGVFKEIDLLEKSELKAKEKIKYEEAYQNPLKIGILLLFLGEFLSRVWWRAIP